MILTKVELGPFRSINTSQACSIDARTTVLVGMNEAGKTVFLQGIHKASDALGVEQFNVIEDYPRKDLTRYNKIHQTNPGNAIKLTYKPEEDEINRINRTYGTNLEFGFTYSISTNYDNKRSIAIFVDEGPVISKVINTGNFTSDTINAIKESKSIRQIVEKLESLDLNESEQKTLQLLQARIKKSNWDSVVQYEVFKDLDDSIPKTLYFSEY